MSGMGHYSDPETGDEWFEPLSDLDAWEENEVFADMAFELDDYGYDD